MWEAFVLWAEGTRSWVFPSNSRSPKASVSAESHGPGPHSIHRHTFPSLQCTGGIGQLQPRAQIGPESCLHKQRLTGPPLPPTARSAQLSRALGPCQLFRNRYPAPKQLLRAGHFPCRSAGAREHIWCPLPTSRHQHPGPSSPLPA